MVVKEHQGATDSQKAEVGEVDTRAPFQSVKDAVSLFGEGAAAVNRVITKKPKTFPTERLLAKETQLHMAQKELNKYKEQLENADITKAQALAELENAKRMVDDLNQKLKTLNHFKESSMKETEAAKNLSQQLEKTNIGNLYDGSSWKEELDGVRNQYAAAVAELDVAKQELIKIRQDFEKIRAAKTAAFREIADAENLTIANRERADELTKEMTAVQESLAHLKLSLTQAQQERTEILSEKDSQRQASRFALQEMEKKLVVLKKEFDSDVARDMNEKLSETAAWIESLQKEMENARASDEKSIELAKTELDGAKRELQTLLEEESSLRTLVKSLEHELETLKKDHSEVKEKEVEAENIAADLHIKLPKSKAELDAVLAGEHKARAMVDELTSTLQQISSDAENARTESEALIKEAEELKKEAEEARIAQREAERNLEVALKEVEEAKAAEESALCQIKTLAEKTDAARSSVSESDGYITISAEEYESLGRKVDESNLLAEMKVAAAMAQVDAVRASESESLKRLEATVKGIEDMEMATKEALKKAEIAEAAKAVVEGELKRWREREQKRAEEAAAGILTEAETPKEQQPLKWDPTEKLPPSPLRPKVVKPYLPVKGDDKHKMEKASAAKKTLMTSLSGIFHRKKNQVEAGSPSQFPGKQHV